MRTEHQTKLPFSKPNETKAERLARIMESLPPGAVVLASELRFNYDDATKLATAKEAKP